MSLCLHDNLISSPAPADSPWRLFTGNFCPLCDKCYDDDDFDSKMMECGRCNHWVHAKCENLTGQSEAENEWNWNVQVRRMCHQLNINEWWRNDQCWACDTVVEKCFWTPTKNFSLNSYDWQYIFARRFLRFWRCGYIISTQTTDITVHVHHVGKR